MELVQMLRGLPHRDYTPALRPVRADTFNGLAGRGIGSIVPGIPDNALDSVVDQLKARYLPGVLDEAKSEIAPLLVLSIGLSLVSIYFSVRGR